MAQAHSFHIPVMGIGFTIDTPLKVSHFGIDSVISLVDDKLIEKLRKVYSEKFEIPYKEITEKFEDFRAERITSYLDLLHNLAEKKFEELKNATIEKGSMLKEYLNMLPDGSAIKKEFSSISERFPNLEEAKNWIKENLSMGSIDVNIMTKIDKENYRDGKKLATEYNDAHAAMRGFANSKLSSSIILSAGMSPRLYGYMEQFKDFYPNKNGDIKKKIVLKVSDFRSALVQGKYLAKKGLWVSEYRIESGLNCGGHAFATEGHLMGPILAEFRDKRELLIQSVREVLDTILEKKGYEVPQKAIPLKITAQGGVGTGEEHQFLLDHYNIDSVGWGSPFLLVPEATTVDEPTMKLLSDSKEKDLYLSDISPLGVPFNSLKGNTKDIEKLASILTGKPGSACPKEFLVSNNEYTNKPLCTASRRYQRLKIKELKQQALDAVEYKNIYDKIVDKACICVGLGTAALITNDLDTKFEGEGVSICPGPNMAYFSKVMSLNEMTSHIYGKSNISNDNRPNMFVKELNIYIDYLKNKFEETKTVMTGKNEKYFSSFASNLSDGINYYQDLFKEAKESFEATKSKISKDLQDSKRKLQAITLDIENRLNLSKDKKE